MHITRLAPELSATSRLVCIWIMGSCSDAADHFPAFQLGFARAFLDFDDHAFLEGALFVMGVEARRAAHGLLQDRVQISALDLNDDGLVALVAHDGSLHHAARHRLKPSSSGFSARAPSWCARSCGGHRARAMSSRAGP